MNTTILSGNSFEREWRRVLEETKKRHQEEEKLKAERIALYMASEQRTIEK